MKGGKCVEDSKPRDIDTDIDIVRDVANSIVAARIGRDVVVRTHYGCKDFSFR